MKRFYELLKISAMVTVCNALLAFAVAAFILPNGIIMGGITGIGIFFEKISGVETELIVFIANGILLLAGRFILSRKLFISTIAGSLLYPAFLTLFKRIPGINEITDNRLLAALFAGALMGVSIGGLMRIGSSTGGMDIVNLALNKWFHKPVSMFVSLNDGIVLLLQATVSTPESVLLGIVAAVIEALLIDKLMILGKAQIQLFVISEKYEAIRKAFLTDIDAGVTMSKIETGYLNREQKAVICVIPQRKLYHTTERIHSIDDNAFITITKINEVQGRGFGK